MDDDLHVPDEPHDLHELTDDALTSNLRVYQRRRGHRYSLDDVATAWFALREQARLGLGANAAPPRTCLDLGCGLGSVLLMLADKLPEARLFGIEAQEVSYELVARNIARNGLAARVSAELGDLRDEAALSALRAQPAVAATRGFELVTGTPPYKPIGTATPSPDAQRAHARLELRGGVEAYLSAASRVLAPTGLCVVCVESAANARVLASAVHAGLHVRSRIDVVPMLGRKGHLFSVHALGRIPPAEAVFVHAPLVARDAAGARTPASRELRSFFGLELRAQEAPSPLLRARRAGGLHGHA
jgi:tRNA1Val (adenine37-N6)-methyltransferase